MATAVALQGSFGLDTPVRQEERLEAFRATAESRRAQLLQVAQRITRRSEDAEDVLQEAFLKAYKALPYFRGEAQMSTWLTSIVKNTALEFLRSQRGRVFFPIEYVPGGDDEVVAIDFPDTRRNPEESCGQRELEELVRGEVNKLSLGCRHVIERCMLDEQPQVEAAEALEIKVATVKARVFRAKRILNRALAARERTWHRIRAGSARRVNGLLD